MAESEEETLNVSSAVSFTEETVSIVLDMGSSLFRVGYSGEDLPRTIFPSLLGRRDRKEKDKEAKVDVNFYIGQEAVSKRLSHGLKVTSPVERGVVTNWDDMENLICYAIYNELKTTPPDHPLLVAESPLSPKGNKEKMAELVFEGFSFPALHIANQGQLALFSANRDTGLSVSCGHGITHVVPVTEGHSLNHASIRLEFGGCDITDYLMTLLTEQGHSFKMAADRENICKVKEAHCYVSFDYQTELESVRSGEESIKQTYTLPSGEMITVNEQRFSCPEVLFDQSRVGMDLYEGLHDMVYATIQKCDRLLRRPLYENIVLSGGTTLLPGLPERLEKEVHMRAPESIDAKVISGLNRQHASWIGGAIFATLSTFEKECTRYSDYEEHGPNIVHRKQH